MAGEGDDDGSVARDSSVWRRAIRGQLSPWKVFWLAFVPALPILYFAQTATMHALVRLGLKPDLELLAVAWSIAGLLVLIIFGLVIWRCASNAGRGIRNHLAPLLVTTLVIWLAWQIFDFLSFSSTLLARDTPRVKAAADLAYCSAFYSIAARSSGTGDKKEARSREATMFLQDSTILANEYFALTETRRSADRILEELREAAEPGRAAARALAFCDRAFEQHRPILRQRMAELEQRTTRSR